MDRQNATETELRQTASETTAQLQIKQWPVTLLTLTTTLAYLQHYTPKLIPTRRLVARDLRSMATWIYAPQPQMRSVKTHTALAVHVALLDAAGLVDMEGTSVTLRPLVTHWLHAPPPQQIRYLLSVLTSSDTWQATLRRLKLENVITIDYTAYLRQSLSNQCLQPTAELQHAQWESQAPDTWQFILPATLPAWLFFDLLQLGRWNPASEPGAANAGSLHCTPLSLAQATQRGYGPDMVRWLLATAIDQPLSPAQMSQLNAWIRGSDAYRVRLVHLLSTAQDNQIQQLTARRHLRPLILEQLSPRHAIVEPELLPKLERWLHPNGFVLNHTATKLDARSSPDLQYHWLGLRVLVALGQLLPLPYPAPHQELQDVGAQLDAVTQASLEYAAQELLGGLRSLIHGRDAFFPAFEPPATGLVDTIKQAIRTEQQLHVRYQAPGDGEPRYRRIQPLRLEERGALMYVHAYCYRTEMNLTFRLDRIHTAEPVA